MKPYIIVLGNEKGGTGKSTVAMHVSVYLLNQGFRVGTIDVDARQGTLSRYFDNRKANATENIKLPEHVAIIRNEAPTKEESETKDGSAFEEALHRLSDSDFIVIDTPGNDTHLSKLAHSYADTLLTPLNDSFIDLDVLVNIFNNDFKSLRPSIYAEMVWNQRKERARRGAKPTDWIVIRNRLTTLYTKNRKDVNTILEALAKRISFRLGVGFCDRVIFKELFPSGLTLLDLGNSGVQLSISHIAARQELRELMDLMKLPNL
jgi:chromosome partitioning protein